MSTTHNPEAATGKVDGHTTNVFYVGDLGMVMEEVGLAKLECADSRLFKPTSVWFRPDGSITKEHPSSTGGAFGFVWINETDGSFVGRPYPGYNVVSDTPIVLTAEEVKLWAEAISMCGEGSLPVVLKKWGGHTVFWGFPKDKDFLHLAEEYVMRGNEATVGQLLY